MEIDKSRIHDDRLLLPNDYWEIIYASIRSTVRKGTN